MANKRNRYISVAVMLAFMIIMLITAGYSQNALPKDEIIFIHRYQNWASGYNEEGFFVMSNGDIYVFDFATFMNGHHGDKGEAFIKRLELVKEYTEPCGSVDASVMQKIYEYGLQIDTSAEYYRESMGCDMGSSQRIFHNPHTGELILCQAYGDWREELQDVYAKKIYDVYCTEFNDKNIYIADSPLLYTSAEMPMISIHCGDTELEGKYLLFTEEQLKHLEGVSGCNITDILDSMSEYERDRYVYVVEFRNVPSGSEELEAEAILYNKHQFQFILDGDTSGMGDGKRVEGTGDGYCFVSAFPWGRVNEEWEKCTGESEWIYLSQ